MRRLVARIRSFGAIAVVIVLGGLVLVGSAFAVAGSTKPDLVPELPAKRPAGLGKSVAPIYVDAYTMPGKLLYRFDTVIRNQGGTMDLYMQNGNAYQVIWKNGHPPGPVSPNHAPSPGPNIISIENRSAQAGAFFVYSPATGHKHWHFQQAARYELLLPGGGSRVSDKIGFCMFDTYPSTTSGKPRFFADGYTGGGQHSWCNRLDPGATFTRMGISPTYGDLYASQASWQWIDISGLKPQSYDFRATVNPLGYVDEGSATARRPRPRTNRTRCAGGCCGPPPCCSSPRRRLRMVDPGHRMVPLHRVQRPVPVLRGEADPRPAPPPGQQQPDPGSVLTFRASWARAASRPSAG